MVAGATTSVHTISESELHAPDLTTPVRVAERSTGRSDAPCRDVQMVTEHDDAGRERDGTRGASVPADLGDLADRRWVEVRVGRVEVREQFAHVERAVAQHGHSDRAVEAAPRVDHATVTAELHHSAFA